MSSCQRRSAEGWGELTQLASERSRKESQHNMEAKPSLVAMFLFMLWVFTHDSNAKEYRNAAADHCR